MGRAFSPPWPCDEARARYHTICSMMFIAHRALNADLRAALFPGAACVPRPSTMWQLTAMMGMP
eukprot:3743774-Lingulodinium_polyedra.AAC.1